MKLTGHNATNWLKFAARLSQEGIGRSKRAAKRTLGIRRPVRIVPFRGYGNGRTATIW